MVVAGVGTMAGGGGGVQQGPVGPGGGDAGDHLRPTCFPGMCSYFALRYGSD
jgi:hypothetical protein